MSAKKLYEFDTAALVRSMMQSAGITKGLMKQGLQDPPRRYALRSDTSAPNRCSKEVWISPMQIRFSEDIISRWKMFAKTTASNAT